MNSSKIHLIQKFIILHICLLLTTAGQAQDTTAQNPPEEKQEQAETPKKGYGNTTVREEIQRYLGFDDILALRYLTLPYDIFQNTNPVKGNFVDIGFLLLIFLPILFVIRLRDKPVWMFSVIILSLLLYILATSSASIIRSDGTEIPAEKEALKAYINDESVKDPLGKFDSRLYILSSTISQPIKNALSAISGERDFFTYPILIAGFVFFVFLVNTSIKSWDHHKKTLVYFLLAYGFLFLLFSAGIIWYGYILIPLSLFILLDVLYRWNKSNQMLKRMTGKTFLGMAGMWSLFAIILLFSNVNYRKDSGKQLIDPPVVLYQMGQYTKEDVFDSYYPNLSRALEKINAEEESLILRAGTPFNFFIKKNDKRILQDNQLGLFDRLVKKYQTKSAINEVLKASGFKYLIVGLNIAKMDYTPEKTLQNKFKGFMNYLYQNPGLELLATNHQVLETDPKTGQQKAVYKVFGEAYQLGSYAIFEIK